jgi:hypothetical protein
VLEKKLMTEEQLDRALSKASILGTG